MSDSLCQVHPAAIGGEMLMSLWKLYFQMVRVKMLLKAGGPSCATGEMMENQLTCSYLHQGVHLSWQSWGRAAFTTPVGFIVWIIWSVISMITAGMLHGSTFTNRVTNQIRTCLRFNQHVSWQHKHPEQLCRKNLGLKRGTEKERLFDRGEIHGWDAGKKPQEHILPLAIWRWDWKGKVQWVSPEVV